MNTIDHGRDNSPALLSVIVPIYNEVDVLDEFFERILVVLDGLDMPTEVVCVNDGSEDDTLTGLTAHAMRDSRIVVVDLSRNFGKEVAMTAGLDHARGEVTVFIDADLQDPPELIPELVTKWLDGYENVYGARSSRRSDTLMKRLTATVFYQLFNRMADVQVPIDAGDFRLLGVQATAALRQLRERRRFMKALFSWVGYPSTGVPYVRPQRAAGKSSFNFWRLWNFAIEGFTSHSSTLLRIWTYLGLLAVAACILLGIFLIFEYFVSDSNPTGFYITILMIIFFGSLQMITLGIIGEYVGRIYDEVKDRPLYLTNSVVRFDETKMPSKRRKTRAPGATSDTN